MGRVEELARLDRWAADPTVRLIGVTAWGGAGKTALVTHWLAAHRHPTARAGVRGVFGWSFYADPVPEHWADALLDWAADTFGLAAVARAGGPVGRGGDRAARALPLVLVLDGLEVAQEGPASDGYGRLLDGSCGRSSPPPAVEHRSLVVLTSRFPFADLAGYDGTAPACSTCPRSPPPKAPPCSPPPPRAPLTDTATPAAGGAGRRARAGRRHHGRPVRRAPRSTAHRPPYALLAEPGQHPAKVNRVLSFYAELLGEPDRYLVAAVSLFARPATPEQMLTVAQHESFGGRLDGWNAWRWSRRSGVGCPGC